MLYHSDKNSIKSNESHLFKVDIRVELKPMKGRSRFKIPWRKRFLKFPTFMDKRTRDSFNTVLFSTKNSSPLDLVFTPASGSLFTHHGSSSSAPRLPTLDPSLRPLCPDPGSPSGVSPRNVHTRLSASAPYPRSASIRVPLVFLNPVLFPYSPSHHLHPGPVSALLLSPSALSPISSLFSPRILQNLNN